MRLVSVSWSKLKDFLTPTSPTIESLPRAAKGNIGTCGLAFWNYIVTKGVAAYEGSKIPTKANAVINLTPKDLKDAVTKTQQALESQIQSSNQSEVVSLATPESTNLNLLCVADTAMYFLCVPCAVHVIAHMCRSRWSCSYDRNYQEAVDCILWATGYWQVLHRQLSYRQGCSRSWRWGTLSDKLANSRFSQCRFTR